MREPHAGGEPVLKAEGIVHAGGGGEGGATLAGGEGRGDRDADRERRGHEYLPRRVQTDSAVDGDEGARRDGADADGATGVRDERTHEQTPTSADGE